VWLYWEKKLNFIEPKHVAIPVAVSVFPDELYAAPRSWVEQPQTFVREVRASFRPIR
jgi:hypothetical protein